MNFKAFNRYFVKFLKASSFPIRLINFKFGFLIRENKNKNKFLCIIDGSKGKTKVIKISSENEIYKHNLEFIIETPIYVFNDCNKKNMHNTFTASKLIEINILKKSGTKKLMKYFNLIDLYENDSLPFTRLLSLRNLEIIFRRFRELVDILFYFLIIKIQNKKVHHLWHPL